MFSVDHDGEMSFVVVSKNGFLVGVYLDPFVMESSANILAGQGNWDCYIVDEIIGLVDAQRFLNTLTDNG